MLLFVIIGLLATQSPAEQIKPHLSHWFSSQRLQSEMLTKIILRALRPLSSSFLSRL